MKLELARKERRSPASIAISFAIHAALAVLLATITWHYPILGVRADKTATPVETRITYIRIPPRARAGEGGTDETATIAKSRLPQRLPAPTSIPSEIPLPSRATPTPGVVAGVPGGTGVAPRGDVVGPTTGITLTIPDPRLNVNPAIVPVPRNLAQMNDSALHAFYQEYRDSVLDALAHPKRAPTDWTFDRNGQKYGWDQDGIHIGKYNIPNAILAAIKIPPGGKSINAVTDSRISAWTYRDLMEHSTAMSNDELKEAVKRIRDRVDRERTEAGKKPANPPKKGGGG